MKALCLTALSVVIVSATLGVPGYAIAAGCDPASGCCGIGQPYTGWQHFTNPAAPFPVSTGMAPSPSQFTNATNAAGAVRKAPVAQIKSVPAAPVAPQGGAHVPEILSFSRIPCLGTLW
jgi:hypothetical protein